MQSERDFAERDENSSPVQLQGRYGRQGTGWFSYDLPVDPASPAILVVTYSNDARGRKGSFDILVDGAKVGEQTMERRSPERDVRFFSNQILTAARHREGQAKSHSALPGKRRRRNPRRLRHSHRARRCRAISAEAEPLQTRVRKRKSSEPEELDS